MLATLRAYPNPNNVEAAKDFNGNGVVVGDHRTLHGNKEALPQPPPNQFHLTLARKLNQHPSNDAKEAIKKGKAVRRIQAMTEYEESSSAAYVANREEEEEDDDDNGEGTVGGW